MIALGISSTEGEAASPGSEAKLYYLASLSIRRNR